MQQGGKALKPQTKTNPADDFKRILKLTLPKIAFELSPFSFGDDFKRILKPRPTSVSSPRWWPTSMISKEYWNYDIAILFTLKSYNYDDFKRILKLLACKWLNPVLNAHYRMISKEYWNIKEYANLAETSLAIWWFQKNIETHGVIYNTYPL